MIMHHTRTLMRSDLPAKARQSGFLPTTNESTS